MTKHNDDRSFWQRVLDHRYDPFFCDPEGNLLVGTRIGVWCAAVWDALWFRHDDVGIWRVGYGYVYRFPWTPPE